jgi:hypothetical protein
LTANRRKANRGQTGLSLFREGRKRWNGNHGQG